MDPRLPPGQSIWPGGRSGSGENAMVSAPLADVE
jgi:hypothetical protein